MKAIWKNTVIAESDYAIEVDGSFYFPPGSVRQELLQPVSRTSFCPWKGTAQYYSIRNGNEVNSEAAWSYAAPKDYAKSIEGYMAFWTGVEIKE